MRRSVKLLQKSDQSLASLTGLRGVAAIWVLLFHVQAGAALDPSWPPLQHYQFFRQGWRAVDLFFILSGFMMMYRHQSEFQTIRLQSVGRFLRARFFRLYPLANSVLLLILMLTLSDPTYVAWARLDHDVSDFSACGLIQTTFLATRWFFPSCGDWNTPVWSLSVEILGYGAFPIIAWRLTRWQSPVWATLLSLACLTAMVGVLAYAGRADDNAIGRIAIARMAGCFLAGCALCRGRSLVAQESPYWAAWIEIGAVIIIIAATCVSGPGPLASIGFAALIYGLAFGRGTVSRILSCTIIVRLGVLSFPLYLVHSTILSWIRYRFHPSTMTKAILMLIAYIAVCIFISAVLHSVVERPTHEFGRRPRKVPLRLNVKQVG